MREYRLGDTKEALTFACPLQNHAIRHCEATVDSFLKRQYLYTLPSFITKLLADIHDVVIVTIIKHAAGYGVGSVGSVCQYSYQLPIFNQRITQIFPRPTCKGDTTHILIREQEAVSKHLKRIECRNHPD